MRLLLWLMIVAGLAGSAHTDSLASGTAFKDGSVLLFSAGRCSEIQIAGATPDCLGMRYAYFPSRLTIFSIGTTAGLLIFGGTESLQSDDTHYSLIVNRVEYDKTNGTGPHSFAAQGRCDLVTEMVDAQEEAVQSLSCDASSAFGPVIAHFSGSGLFVPEAPK